MLRCIIVVGCLICSLPLFSASHWPSVNEKFDVLNDSMELLQQKGRSSLPKMEKLLTEMRERVDQLVGYGAEHIWVSTVHSTCVRILRRHIDKLGFGNSFTIYDADDQKSLIRGRYVIWSMTANQLIC